MKLTQIRSNDGTGTLSYLISCDMSGNGVIIDPNIEDLEFIKDQISEGGVKLKYIVDTHTHADHVTAAPELREMYGAKVIMHKNTVNKWKVVDQGDKFGIGDILRKNAKSEVDNYVDDGDQIKLDSITMKFLHTPGHTDNHIAVLIGDMLFTGDLLLIGQAGRSDLPGGDAEEQYDSLYGKVLPLPEKTKIYPGHDYEDNQFSYLGDEKKSNPFLSNMNKEEYVKFVQDYFPPFAEAGENGKVILQCGTKRVSTEKEEFKDISAGELAKMKKDKDELFLLDVRESFELMAFGKIPGVVNISMREIADRLDEIPKDKKVVVICQSGNRSFEAAHYLKGKGYPYVYNLDGGTSGWMFSRDPLVKEYAEENA
jgi:glyoxylase-like metal-dependent hydrolase (beta-lactamase superfamily II)/rhodanese-related sulfurtransferase